MFTRQYPVIERAFGKGARWLDLDDHGLKGMVYIPPESDGRLSRYDARHITEFIKNGVYVSLFREVNSKIAHGKIVFGIDCGTLNIFVVRKGKEEITVLKRLYIGLFYGRSETELIGEAMRQLKSHLGFEIKTESEAVRSFYETFKKEDLSSVKDIQKNLTLFGDLRGKALNKREKGLIMMHYKHLDHD